MRRKVFSLMMMLLLAVTGMVRAEVVTIGSGTSTSSYLPTYPFYNYSLTQQIYTESEIGVTGKIVSLGFYNAGSAKTRNLDVYVVATSKTIFESTTDWITVTAADKVFSGSVTLVAGDWTTIQLNEEFTYGGGNIAVIVDDNTGSYESGFSGRVFSATNQALRIYSDGTNYNPLAPTSYTGTRMNQKNQLQIGFYEQPAVYVNPDPIDLGARPNNAWMRPLDVEMTARGMNAEVVAIEASNPYFAIDAEIPAVLNSTNALDFQVRSTQATAGPVNGQLVVMTQDRQAFLFDMMATAYDPVANDVVETAGSPITFTNGTFTATVGTGLYDNYQLPGQYPDGKDVVYKMQVNEEKLLNVQVDGNDGKWAVYTETQPMADNFYTGPVIGEGGGDTPFNVQIGEGTSTTGYFPFYTLYNYSIAECLFLADELLEAGVNTTDMASLSWYATNAPGYAQKGIKIWMANVSDEALTTTSHSVNDMTLVFDDNNVGMTPQIGWNEFEFNQGSFAWDGVSNILIFVQRNNGEWNSTVSWEAGNVGFNAMAYKYQDSGAYDPTIANTMYTSTTRPNIMIKSEGVDRNGRSWVIGDDLVMVPGTYFLVASSTSDEFTVTATLNNMPMPEVVSNPSPADLSTGITSPVILSWTLGAYTTEYRVLLGTTYPPQDILVDWTSDLAQSYRVNGLYNNKNYFWRVDERNASGTTTGPVWGFTTALNIPQNLAAADQKIYEGDVAQISWTAVQDRSMRGYNIYVDGGKLNTNPVVATNYQIEGLTYNMLGYTVNVTAVYDEGESDFSSDLVLYVSGDGSASGKVTEQDGATGINGVTVHYEGVDEFERPASYTFTTNAAGNYQGALKAGIYLVYAEKAGYQNVMYNDVVEVEYGYNTGDIDLSMYENFDPVAEVIAEEIDENLVKVYWSQSIMSEVIEDFESGDFNMYPWVNDPTYPWQITTTNPYEGIYCMMSGNYNIASSTSAIEITYEIPYDGLMSFFGKISSENNWDYGYFYIDGVEKASFTGAGSWNEKEFPITEGTHTFKWAYTKDGSVNSNDDRFYVDYVSFFHHAEPTPPGMTIYDFDDSTMQGWTAIDADGDGFNWDLASSLMGTGYGHNGTNDCAVSQSYSNTYGVLYPDNYLVSPQVALGGVFQFYACAQDASYAAEHFGVAVSTTSATAGAFTTIQEWTMTAKSVGAPTDVTRSGNRAQGNWYQFTVDLSAYAGQTGYVAIRHFNCSDMFYLDVDDIGLNNGGKGMMNVTAETVNMPKPGVNRYRSGRNNRSFTHYNVYRATCNDPESAELIAEVSDTVYMDVAWANLEPGVYMWGVSRVYEGNRESNISWANPAGDRATFTYDFDDSTFEGWSEIDADGDGFTWDLASSLMGTGYGHNGSTDCMVSQSYDNNYGVLYPDNYLVSPQVALGGSITFYACAQDNSYAAEHFGVAVSTTSATAAAFTTIQEWTMTAKGAGAPTNVTRSGSRTQGNWYEYTVDLSAYAGQTGYVAIRHFNCSDWFYLDVDDITIVEGGATPPTPPTPPTGGGEGESDIVFSECIDHDMYHPMMLEVTANDNGSVEGAVATFVNITEPELGLVYYVTLDESGIYTFDSFRRGIYEVSVVLDGYDEYYEVADLWDALLVEVTLEETIGVIEDLYVSTTGWAMFGEVVGPGPVPPTPVGGDWYYYDNGVNEDAIGTNGGEFWWGVMFPAGSYTGNMVTKVAAYDYMAMNGDVTIFNDGASAPATAVGTTSVSFTGSEQFVEFDFASPVMIDPTKNVWVVFHNASGATFPAAVCANTGDANGRWVSLDGASWDDLAGYGLSYTFMVRAYIASGKGEVQEIAYEPRTIEATGTFSNAGVAKTRGVQQYLVRLNGTLDGVTVLPFFQHNEANLVPGETYRTSVKAIYGTDESPWSDEFEWVYTPCDEFVGLVSDPTADWDGDDVVLNWELPEVTPVNPPTGNTTFSTSFEGGLPEGWTVIDANNDGWTWTATSAIPSTWTYYASLTLDWYRTGTDAMCSGSYINGVGALNPDEYLVAPQVSIVNGSQLSLWAAATDASYPADHFGVFISTTGTNPSDFTSVQEWTLTAKREGMAGGSASRDGEGLRLGTWYNYTVDLSAYAGSNAYIAIRHFNCYDQYIMCLDDVELTAPAKGEKAPWDLMASFEAAEAAQYGVASDGEYIYTCNWGYSGATNNFYKYDLDGNVIEGFSISGCGTIRDLTYDGTYFYGGANSSTLYCIDLANKTLISSTSTTCSGIRHCSYDPVNDGFWVGGWSDLKLIDRSGATITNGPAVSSVSGTGYFTADDGSAHLYLFTQANSDAKVYDFDIATNTVGSMLFDFSTCPGYNAGSSGGAFVGEYNGKTAIFLDAQQSPNLIGIYELAEGSGPVPPVPPVGEGIIGVEIFRDGEWIAEVAYPETTYRDIDPGYAEEYEIRVVYNGSTADWTYYAMSCPEVAIVGEASCDAPENLDGTYYWEAANDFGAILNWTYGEAPVPPLPAEWYYYDNGVNEDAIGTNGGEFWWGVMFPAGSYAGGQVFEVAAYDYMAMSGTVTIYNDGTSAPSTPVGTANVTFTGSEDFVEFEFATPVNINPAKNLWVVFDNVSMATFPAAVCANTGDANGRWVSLDGSTWEDLAGYGLSYTFMVRAYIGGAKGEVEVLSTVPTTLTETGTLANAGQGFGPAASASNLDNVLAGEPIGFNIYRDGDVIDIVEYEGEGEYVYVDQVGIGVYDYQVTAIYADGCESDFALTPDLGANYVTIDVDAVSENNTVAIYPNPTTGNVKIEATEAMTHITVVSILGQVVYDADFNGMSKTLDLGQFNAGVYMVRINTEKGVSVNRITVVK